MPQGIRQGERKPPFNAKQERVSKTGCKNNAQTWNAALKANNLQAAFSVVRRLRRSFAPKQRNIFEYLNKNGRLLSDTDDIKKRWRRYTEQLYSDESGDDDASAMSNNEERRTALEITPVLVD